MSKLTYQNLRLAIWDKGLTQRKVAKLIGISEQLMSLYVNGKREMPEQIKRKIHLSCFPEQDFEQLFKK